MKLEQLAGSLSTYPLDAAAMLKAWFDPDDLVYITGKRTIKSTGSKNVISQGMSARELVTDLSGEDGCSIMESLIRSNDGTLWDMYVNVSPVGAPLTSMSERVKEVNVSRVIGVIADLDVKVGGFCDGQQIIAFLDSLVAKPTIVVASGSGGYHAYWKFIPDHGQPVGVELGKDTAARWWTYIDEQAMAFAGAHVDKLFDMARMLRLPGSMRWPKPEEASSPRPVRLVRSDGPGHRVSTLREHSEAAWGRRLERVHKTREIDRNVRFSSDQLASIVINASENRWANYQAIAHVEDFFNELISWDDILLKAGWTRLRTDSAGRVEWCRPGRNEKSATVDWPESPHVMSLLSTSHDTNLLDLLDAGIPLTKWRVALRLLWNDDYAAMVTWTLGRMGI